MGKNRGFCLVEQAFSVFFADFPFYIGRRGLFLGFGAIPIIVSAGPNGAGQFLVQGEVADGVAVNAFDDLVVEDAAVRQVQPTDCCSANFLRLGFLHGGGVLSDRGLT